MLNAQKMMMMIDAINSCYQNEVYILIITDSVLPIKVPVFKTRKIVYTKTVYIRNISDIGKAMYHAVGTNIIFTDLRSEEYADMVRFLKPIDIAQHTSPKLDEDIPDVIKGFPPITGRRRPTPTTSLRDVASNSRQDNDPTLELYYYSTLYAGSGSSNSISSGSSKSSSSDSGYSSSSSSSYSDDSSSDW
jgi:hypothetical protein